MSCEFCKRNLRIDARSLENKIWCGGCEKDVKYISFPFGKQYYNKPEFVPSYPPWTTFNGVILCKDDSKEGNYLKVVDPNYDQGFYLDKDGNKIILQGYIRGYWTSSKIDASYYSY